MISLDIHVVLIMLITSFMLLPRQDMSNGLSTGVLDAPADDLKYCRDDVSYPTAKARDGPVTFGVLRCARQFRTAMFA